jgi:hypothetical protein
LFARVDLLETMFRDQHQLHSFTSVKLLQRCIMLVSSVVSSASKVLAGNSVQEHSLEDVDGYFEFGGWPQGDRPTVSRRTLEWVSGQDIDEDISEENEVAPSDRDLGSVTSIHSQNTDRQTPGEGHDDEDVDQSREDNYETGENINQNADQPPDNDTSDTATVVPLFARPGSRARCEKAKAFLHI